jgi:TolB protein
MRNSVALVAALIGLIALTTVPASANAPGPAGRIAFSRFDPARGDDFVFTANPDGSQEQQLLATGAEGPAWSPDGEQVLVDPHETLAAARIVDVADGTYRDLAMPDPDLLVFCVRWSPDGTRLVCDGFGAVDPARNGIYTIRSADGGGLTRISANPRGEDDPGDYSPNGKRLVYLHFEPASANDPLALYTVKVDGSDARRITPVGLFPDFAGGRWSPQGNEIVFSGKYAPTSPSSLFVVHADGSNLRQVGSDGGAGAEFDPSWSPDGKRIIFSRRATPDARADLYTVDEDGTNLTRVTDTPTLSENSGADWGTHPLGD